MSPTTSTGPAQVTGLPTFLVGTAIAAGLLDPDATLTVYLTGQGTRVHYRPDCGPDPEPAVFALRDLPGSTAIRGKRPAQEPCVACAGTLPEPTAVTTADRDVLRWLYLAAHMDSSVTGPQQVAVARRALATRPAPADDPRLDDAVAAARTTVAATLDAVLGSVGYQTSKAIAVLRGAARVNHDRTWNPPAPMRLGEKYEGQYADRERAADLVARVKIPWAWLSLLPEADNLLNQDRYAGDPRLAPVLATDFGPHLWIRCPGDPWLTVFPAYACDFDPADPTLMRVPLFVTQIPQAGDFTPLIRDRRYTRDQVAAAVTLADRYPTHRLVVAAGAALA